MAEQKLAWEGGEPPEHWKDRVPIVLARVSTTRQRESLPEQVLQMKDDLKSMGFRQEPLVVSIRTSGKTADLQTLRDVKSVIEDAPRVQKNRGFVVFVRDTPRLARHTRQALKFVDDMAEKGVPIVPLDLNQTVGRVGTNSRTMFTVFAAIAEGGKASEYNARRDRQERRAEEGVVSGVPRDFYPEKMKGNRTVYDQVWSFREAVRQGNMSLKEMARAVDLYPQMATKILTELEELEEREPGKGDEYREVVRAIVRIEKQRGVGSRARKPARLRTRRAVALHRVSVGYLQSPFDFPRPDTVGNPDTARRDSRDKAKGTLQDAVDNPEWYIPDKR